MTERKRPDAPEPAQDIEPLEGREPLDPIVQEELRGNGCEAKCPSCDEGFCENDPAHSGDHWCALCAMEFQSP
jgi:hypothetical protein